MVCGCINSGDVGYEQLFLTNISVRLAVAVGTSKRVAVKIILKDLTSRESIEKEVGEGHSYHTFG